MDMFYKKTIDNFHNFYKKQPWRKTRLATLPKKIKRRYFRVYYSVEPLWTAAFETSINRYEAREG